MQNLGDPLDASLEQLLQTCSRVPPAQMLLSTAVSVTRTFFASAPRTSVCREWEGAVHNMSQCLACVAEALATADWTPEFLHFVRTSISKADVVALLQTISQIVSEAMVAVLYYFMCICCNNASPDWSILFTSGQSLTQSLALVAQLLQAHTITAPARATYLTQPPQQADANAFTSSKLQRLLQCLPWATGIVASAVTHPSAQALSTAVFAHLVTACAAASRHSHHAFRTASLQVLSVVTRSPCARSFAAAALQLLGSPTDITPEEAVVKVFPHLALVQGATLAFLPEVVTDRLDPSADAEVGDEDEKKEREQHHLLQRRQHLDQQQQQIQQLHSTLPHEPLPQSSPPKLALVVLHCPEGGGMCATCARAAYLNRAAVSDILCMYEGIDFPSANCKACFKYARASPTSHTALTRACRKQRDHVATQSSHDKSFAAFLDAITAIPRVSHLPRAHIDNYFRRRPCRRETAEAGAVLMKQGDVSSVVIYMLIGSVSVVVDGCKRASVEAPAMIGHHSFIYHRARTASIVCEGHVAYFQVALDDLLAANTPDMAQADTTHMPTIASNDAAAGTFTGDPTALPAADPANLSPAPSLHPSSDLQHVTAAPPLSSTADAYITRTDAASGQWNLPPFLPPIQTTAPPSSGAVGARVNTTYNTTNSTLANPPRLVVPLPSIPTISRGLAGLSISDSLGIMMRQQQVQIPPCSWREQSHLAAGSRRRCRSCARNSQVEGADACAQQFNYLSKVSLLLCRFDPPPFEQLKLRSAFDQQLDSLRAQLHAVESDNIELRGSVRANEGLALSLQEALHRAQQQCKEQHTL